MDKVTIKLRNISENPFPQYIKPGDSGFDLRAWTTSPEEKDNITFRDETVVILKPFQRRIIHTGIFCQLPKDTEIQIRPKSGQTLKKGLVVANTPATVDSNYTGEICVIAFNISDEPITISNGERIAQAVVCPVYVGSNVNLVEVEELMENEERGEKGFGHSGIF